MSHQELESATQVAVDNVPLGTRLRLRRESLGLSLHDAAARLHIKQHLIEQMEKGQFDALGAPVYVRGYLGAYLRLLDMPLVLVRQSIDVEASLDAETPLTFPAAVSKRSNQGLLRLVRRTGHVFLTAAIVVPVIWLASYGQLPSRKAEITPLEVPVSASQGDPQALHHVSVAAPTVPVVPAGVRNESYPVMASLAPTLPPSVATESDAEPNPNGASQDVGSGLVLNVTQDSWVEVRNASGVVVDMGVFRAGTEHRYNVEPGYRLALGNANGVEVHLNGEVLDVSPYQRANVARITLGEDGIAPPTGG